MKNETKTEIDEDAARLKFLVTKAPHIRDLSVHEAKLVDDINEHGDRELKPHERHMVERLMGRARKI